MILSRFGLDIASPNRASMQKMACCLSAISELMHQCLIEGRGQSNSHLSIICLWFWLLPSPFDWYGFGFRFAPRIGGLSRRFHAAAGSSRASLQLGSPLAYKQIIYYSNEYLTIKRSESNIVVEQPSIELVKTSQRLPNDWQTHEYNADS